MPELAAQELGHCERRDSSQNLIGQRQLGRQEERRQEQQEEERPRGQPSWEEGRPSQRDGTWALA